MPFKSGNETNIVIEVADGEKIAYIHRNDFISLILTYQNKTILNFNKKCSNNVTSNTKESELMRLDEIIYENDQLDIFNF